MDEKLVLVSQKPWFGEELPDDGTADLARKAGAGVIEHDWATEQEQRNAGQEYFSDFDWIIVLDPDEYLTNDDWDKLFEYIGKFRTQIANSAFIVGGQYTYWKDGYVADPPKDYQQLILIRPNVRFIDKRVVNCGFVVLDDIWIHHFSWAKTDKEVLEKITHYAHANDFDVMKWYNEVWLKWKPGVQDVHPTTPETLHDLIPAKLPKELEKLKLWP